MPYAPTGSNRNKTPNQKKVVSYYSYKLPFEDVLVA
jgi:hypothetical protein